MISHIPSTCLIALSRFFLLLLVPSLACAMLLSPHGQKLSNKSSLHISSTNDSHDLIDSLSLNISAFIQLNNSSINRDDGCFDAASEPRLIPAQINDCLQATQQILQRGSLTRAIIMARKLASGSFQLPQVFRHGTCVISVDVAQDEDIDRFPVLTVYKAALELSMNCVWESTHVGGKIFVGPKKLVYVQVFGRTLPAATTSGAIVRVRPNRATFDDL